MKNKKYASFHELAEYGKNLPELILIWGKYIVEKSVVHFPSERGTGKTYLMMQLCLAISSGVKQFLGEKIGVNGNTLFINCELSAELMARRLAHLMKNCPFSLTNEFTASVYTSRENFSSIKVEVIDIIKRTKPVLVVLDNWKTAFSNINGNSNNETSKVIIELLDLKDEYNFSLVIVDHTRKGTAELISNSDLQSGAGSKSDLSDQDFLMRKSCQNSNYRLLKRSKGRNFEDQKHPKLLQLNVETMWFELVENETNEAHHLNSKNVNSSDELQKAVEDLKDEGLSYSQIGEKLKISKSKVGRILKK